MEKILRSIGKFTFPAMTIIIGAALLISSLNKETPQPTGVIMGATAILIVGILALLFLLDLVKKPIRVALLFISLLGAAYLLYESSNSITSEMAARKEAKFVKGQTVQGLKDVRSALEAYRLANGKYTQDLDELTAFVKNGTVPKMMKIGSLPDSIASEAQAKELGLIVKMPPGMTAEQVEAQGLIVRDTVQISVMEDKFENAFAKKNRVYPFDIKNIKFSPYSQKQWNIKAGYASLGGVQQPVVEVTDPEPYGDTQALMIGSLKAAHLNGNWDDD